MVKVRKGGPIIKVAIHQPNHWPYLGFIDKLRAADLFVVLDIAQFVERDFHHRNRIRINNMQGFNWLTVPVEKKRLPIKNIRIDNNWLRQNRTWNEHHLATIKEYYYKAPYYNAHSLFLERLYGKKWDSLLGLNMAIIYYLKDIFEANTPIIMSSSLKCIKQEEQEHSTWGPPIYEPLGEEDRYERSLKATQRIIEICKEIGGDVFISGISGKNYMIEGLFDKEGVMLEYQHFEHPVYRQCFSPFVPNLSALDYVMNVDPVSGVEEKDPHEKKLPIYVKTL